MSEQTPHVRDLRDQEGPMEIVECPVADCVVPAEVVVSWVDESGGRAVEHRMTRCITGHLVTPAASEEIGDGR